MNINHLLDFQLWTNELIKNATLEVEDIDSKSAENIRSLRQLLEHYVESYDYSWLKESEYKGRMENLHSMSLQELLAELDRSASKFYEVMKNISEEKEVQVSKDKKVTLSRGNYILLHTDHLTYHRGQIVTALKKLGSDGVNLDYYSFILETL